jgi:hypothetical protein
MKLPSRTQLAKDSLEFLTRILVEVCVCEPKRNHRAAFIYRHDRNISDLGADVLALELDNRTSAARIVVRPMLESLFSLTAAVKIPSFAAEKTVAEIEDEIERIQKLIAFDGSPDPHQDLSETVQLLQKETRRLRDDFNITTKNTWNVWATAKAADLSSIYVRHYFLHSKYVHATVSGIIGQEYQTGRASVIQTAIMVTLTAAGHVAQILETATPQAHIGEAARLMSVAIDLMKEQSYEDD